MPLGDEDVKRPGVGVEVGLALLAVLKVLAQAVTS
jgi:hypothetical protein